MEDIISIMQTMRHKRSIVMQMMEHKRSIDMQMSEKASISAESEIAWNPIFELLTSEFVSIRIGRTSKAEW